MWGRYPLVRQDDSSDCGAAALATIARHYRLPLGLQQLRELAGTDRAGTSFLGLRQAAERIGFLAQGVKGSFDNLADLPFPAIAHVRNRENEGHFVVLYQVKPKRVVIGDPSWGIEKLSSQEFCKRWSGALLLLVPADESLTRKKGSIPPSPWVRFMSLLAAHSGLLFEAFFCALFMTLLGIGTSFYLQHLVDSVLVRHDVRLLNALGIGMVLLIAFRMLFGALRHYLLAFLGRKVDLGLIAGYTRHILGLPMQFFEMRQIGDILSRINDAAKVREAISGTTLTTLVDGTLVVVLLGTLWLYDWSLALVATISIPVLVLGVMAHHPASRKRSRKMMEDAALLAAHQVEDVAGVETIKAFGAETLRAEEGENRLVAVVQSLFSLQILNLSMNSLGTALTALAGLAVLWVGGYRVMNGGLSIGELLFCYSLVGFLLTPLERLASVNLRLQEALVAVDRLFQILDLEAEALHDSRKIAFTGVRQDIVLRDVCFRYGHRPPVLDKITLRIPAGKTVAIVGESGSGKSTLLKLLMGFYYPTEGRLLIDGVDVRDFDLGSLRQRLRMVSQDPFIFNGTFRENVVLGRSQATLAEVMAATRAAGLEEFITGLPERFETMIGERGTNLSGGQRQRLAIARALLETPEILIFDEATSHLDTATERAIQENLHHLLEDKTVILVAHRLSTIKEADLVYVLHQGKIVEEGTHRQLLARKGRYESLWRSQTEEEIIPDASGRKMPSLTRE